MYSLFLLMNLLKAVIAALLLSLSSEVIVSASS
jgi:hypothetical protein